jgi:hypothetical protein
MPFPQDQVAWMLANRSTVFRYIRVLQLITGLILLALGYHMGNKPFHLIRTGERTHGRIVAYQARTFTSAGAGNRSSSTTTGYMPIVEFRTNDSSVRFEDWLGSPRQAALNSAVPVLYDRATPTVAMIDRPVGNWLPWAPVFALGLFLLLVGIKNLLTSAQPS